MTEQSERSKRSVRILIVDDNRDAAESLQTILRLEGHEVGASFSGPEALEEAERLKPELVILDIGMPGMDGYETARKLRELPGLGNVGLVALSGWGQETDRERSAAAGFTAHLVKPVDFKQLNALLAKFTAEQPR